MDPADRRCAPVGEPERPTGTGVSDRTGADRLIRNGVGVPDSGPMRRRSVRCRRLRSPQRHPARCHRGGDVRSGDVPPAAERIDGIEPGDATGISGGDPEPAGPVPRPGPQPRFARRGEDRDVARRVAGGRVEGTDAGTSRVREPEPFTGREDRRGQVDRRVGDESGCAGIVGGGSIAARASAARRLTQIRPSPADLMATGLRRPGAVNAVGVACGSGAAGSIRPTRSVVGQVNQSLPSAPGMMFAGPRSSPLGSVNESISTVIANPHPPRSPWSVVRGPWFVVSAVSARTALRSPPAGSP
jgi:hypothetical protein